MRQLRWARERSEDNGKFAKLQREAPLRRADRSVALLISHREVTNYFAVQKWPQRTARDAW